MKEFFFDNENKFAVNGITQSLVELSDKYEHVAFVCVGTDANMGDSLGPLCGSMITRGQGDCFVYGKLGNTVTAAEIPFIREFLTKAHPNTFIVVIDAAVGKSEDVGQIKVFAEGIKPGLGVNKDLPNIGNCSIIGVVSEKNKYNISLLNFTRLSLVYSMAEKISSAINDYLVIRSKKGVVKRLNMC